MAKVAVVFHSGYGHTLRMAQSVAQGAGAELVAIDADGNLTEAQWATLTAADAIIMGSPTYMGSVSWQFKKFADASSKPWFSQQWKDKVFAGFTNSASMNGDKHSTPAGKQPALCSNGCSFLCRARGGPYHAARKAADSSSAAQL